MERSQPYELLSAAQKVVKELNHLGANVEVMQVLDHQVHVDGTEGELKLTKTHE